MNRLDAIMNRRSIRKFTDQPVEREKIEALLRAAMQAPSGKNCQSWEFLVVEDPETMKAISEMSPFGMCAKNGKAVILVLANLIRAEAVGASGALAQIWVQDVSAATMNLLTQAEAEGLGATWLCMYPFENRTEALREYFCLPDHIVPFAAIALGYKGQEKCPEDRYDAEKVHWGAYGAHESE